MPEERSCAVNFFVAQNQKYEGDQSWKWSLWIDGAEEDLDDIELWRQVCAIAQGGVGFGHTIEDRTALLSCTMSNVWRT